MKKLIVLVFTVILSTTGFAQGLDFGVKAGVNFASISDASGFSNRTGFTAGIFAGAKFGDKIGLQADLLYSQQGAKVDFGSFDLNYVNVPIVLKYYLTDSFHIHAGPQFGVLIDDKTQTVIGETINDIGTNEFDVSGVLGVGLDLPMGLRFDARYNLGFSDVPDEKGALEKGKNRVITLSVGYSFL